MKSIAVALVGMAACSSSQAPLTCHALTAAADCMAQQAAALAACMPLHAATMVSPSTCRFADGVTVAFSDPLYDLSGQYQMPFSFTVLSPDGTPCGALASSTIDQYETSLKVIGQLPSAGAEWTHYVSRGTLDLVCGTTATHFDTDVADDACSVAEPSFTAVPGSPYVFDLTTAATTGALFVCQ